MRLNIVKTPEFDIDYLSFSILSSVDEENIPDRFQLFDNYPNPFNPSTTFSFNLPSRTFVTLKIFDVIGREVAMVVSDELPAGNHAWQWNAQGLTSGVYFYRIQAGDFVDAKKLMILK